MADTDPNVSGPIDAPEPTADDFIADDTPEREDSPPVRPVQEPDGDDDGAPAKAQDSGADPAPEFWTPEAKELWGRVTDPDLRAQLKEMNARERAAVSKRFEEAAERVKASEAAKAKYENDIGHVTQWFEQNGPHIVQTIQGRWAPMTPERWQALARENPAQYVEAKAMFEADMAKAADVARQHQGIRHEMSRRQQVALEQAKAAEHAKLAAELPIDFGTPNKAQKTYNTLSQYLIDQGIAGERLAGVYEAPIVKIIQKAYKYDQLQARLKAGGTQPANGMQNATTTPRRIQPGPASNGSGNRQTDAQRQAIEALRSGKKLSEDEAGLAFR